jgi:hypothetical protein
VQAAYTATTHAKTATFQLAERIRVKSADGSSHDFTITGHGQTDFAASAAAVSLTIPNSGTLKFLLVDGIEYLQVPAAARRQIPGHKPWVSMNLNKISRAKLGASFSQLASAGNSNPSQALSQLVAVSSGVSKVGKATVAGVPTTEYRAQVNLTKVAAQAQAREGPRAAQAAREQIKALGTATLPVHVWVDAHQLVRQIRYQVPIPAAMTGGANGGGTAVLTMSFAHFGAPVHLNPPPPGQTADITNQVLQHAKAASG